MDPADLVPIAAGQVSYDIRRLQTPAVQEQVTTILSDGETQTVTYDRLTER